MIGMIDFIGWLANSIRVPKDSFVKVLDDLDADDDGYISLGEAIRAVRGLR